MTQHPERTPPDHVVIGLRIDAALIPDWFDEVRRIAVGRVRRMAVVEKPDVWVVQCELHRDNVEAFKDALAVAWRKRQGADTDLKS